MKPTLEQIQAELKLHSDIGTRPTLIYALTLAEQVALGEVYICEVKTIGIPQQPPQEASDDPKL